MVDRPIQVCIVGARGKMGMEIGKAIKQDPNLTIMWEIDLEQAKGPIKSITDIPWKRAKDTIDVVINFTNPTATLESAIWCAEHSVPLVTGTTGLIDVQKKEMQKLAGKVPMVLDSNMSQGVNLIDSVLPRFAEVLAGFAIEIVEIHHDQKKDYPSGTAIRFAQTLVKAKGGEIVYGRAKGKSDNRPINEVVVHAIRGGTVPGEHTIYFFGPDEVIEIKHQALSRRIFALGAIKAAKWIVNVKPGFYSMNDVLGL